MAGDAGAPVRRPGWQGQTCAVGLCLVVLLSLPLSRPREVGAATGITMSVVPGFHGQVRPGAWLPLVVDLSDAGGDFQGAIVIPDEAMPTGWGGPQQLHNVYSAPVVLSTGSHKRLTLYVPAVDAQGGSVEVRLVDAGGTTQLTQHSPVQTLSTGSLMAGVLSDDPAVARLLSGTSVGGTTLTTIALTPRDLVPEVAALRNFDLLVLSNAPTDALTPAQIEALRAWVSSGGTLLIAGGPTARRTLAGLPPDLVPVRVSGTATLSSLAPLARLSGSALPDGPVTVSTSRPRVGMVLAAEPAAGGAPLLVDAPLGGGHLLYLALDLALAPLSGLPPTDPFWQALLGHALAPAAALALAGPGPGGPFNNGNLYNMNNVLNTLPAAALPPVGLFLTLIGLYVLALGPANYLVLRRLRRLELSWVTIPVVAALFCAGTFAMALQGKGSAVLLNTVSVIHLDETAGMASYPSQSETYLGLFSPSRGDYRLSVPGSPLPMALPSYGFSPVVGSAANALGLVFTQGEPTTVDFKNMGMWSLRSLILQGQTSIAGAIDAHLHLGAGGAIVGTLTNRTRLSLVDVALVTPGNSLVVGALPPAATRAISLAPALGSAPGSPPIYQLYQNSSGGAPPAGSYVIIPGPRGRAIRAFKGFAPYYPGSYSNAPSQQIQNYQNVLSAVFPNGDTSTVAPLLLVAWNHTPLTSLTINGEAPHRQDLNMLLQPLSFSLTTGPFTLPEGVVAPQLVDGGGASQTGGGLNITSGNAATFSFAVPAAGHTVHVDRLSVNVATNGGPSVVQSDSGALYDWSHARWDTVDLSNGDLHVAGAARYVSAQGLVRLRLTAPANSNLYLNNVGSSIQLGATGTVR